MPLDSTLEYSTSGRKPVASDQTKLRYLEKVQILVAYQKMYEQYLETVREIQINFCLTILESTQLFNDPAYPNTSIHEYLEFFASSEQVIGIATRVCPFNLELYQFWADIIRTPAENIQTPPIYYSFQTEDIIIELARLCRYFPENVGLETQTTQLRATWKSLTQMQLEIEDEILKLKFQKSQLEQDYSSKLTFPDQKSISRFQSTLWISLTILTGLWFVRRRNRD